MTERAPRRIKLMADYHCHPLWDLDRPDNVDPRGLPLSELSVAALERWARRYDATLAPDDPALSGFDSLADLDAFNARGQELRVRLARELGGGYEVTFWPELPPGPRVPRPPVGQPVERPAPAAVRPAEPRDVAETQAPAEAPSPEQLDRLLARVGQFEVACRAGSHVRSFVDAAGEPAGFAWVPAGLDDVPHLDHRRVVELEGPAGQRLLFIPLGVLGPMLRRGGRRQGLTAEQLRPLASLAPGSAEVAVNGLFSLLVRLTEALPEA